MDKELFSFSIHKTVDPLKMITNEMQIRGKWMQYPSSQSKYLQFDTKQG